MMKDQAGSISQTVDAVGPQKEAGHTHGVQAPPSLFLVVVLAAVSAIPQLAIDIYLPGLPQLARDLGAEAFAVQLTLTAFMVGLAAGQLVFGPLSDQFGRRGLMLWGSAVCALATLLCALAPNVEILILLRFLQGASGAAGVVLARAVLADRTSGRQAARLFSLMMAIQGIAPVAAPLIGGVVVELMGWRGVFGVLAGAAVVLWLLTLLFVRESLPPDRRQAGGLAALLRSTAEVLRNRRFLGYCLAVGFGLAAMFAYIAGSPFILQNLYGLSPGWYSVAFAVNAAGIAVLSAVSARLAGRVSPQALLGAGQLLMLGAAGSYLVLALLGAGSLAGTLVLFFVLVAGLGLILGNATALAIEQAPRAAGTAAAVIGAAEFLIGAVVAPLVGLGGTGNEALLGLVMFASVLIAVASALWAGAGRGKAA
ncbi:multidrug effflux MFS transporter [Arthrobacter sp. GCM10027362]|uniref:multidrug effflux MFS transporter n=1 Tax=Arthrobacter sp. GCM10027362 TaxID=3273379 RepID=UPI003645F55F